MVGNPVVLVHGWSATGTAFGVWERILRARGFDVRVCTYRSLSNEVTIGDLAEGFDRALRAEAGLEGPFDAVVHSTGMLVVRAWAVRYGRGRLRRLVGLAPATNGSPLAHKGRSWLGAVFRGNRQWGPDFMEAGDRILEGLELGSRLTWDLAEADLFGEGVAPGPGGTRPFAFIFCGARGYGGVAGLRRQAGTDGTVRLAGAGLDSRKVVVDLTGEATVERRVRVIRPRGADVPVHPVSGVNHGTILSDPPGELVEMVLRALQVADAADWVRWQDAARAVFARGRAEAGAWQQFMVRCVDERGDPVPDYNVQLLHRPRAGRLRGVRAFDLDVHVNRADPSRRCFHVDLAKLSHVQQGALQMRLIASSGSQVVRYCGVGDADSARGRSGVGKWDAVVELSQWGDFRFFHPFTTTFVEVRLNREPWPFEVGRKNGVCWFGQEEIGGYARDGRR